tara:strand:- start:342 stop:752 length:411 start_codon:yes stop_codon:yes gene_type:complete
MNNTNSEGNMQTIETAQDTTAISAQARGAAQQAQTAFLKHWNDTTGGNEYGEPMYCGFAWVTVYPEHKGNTKLGKGERRVLESMGFKKDWTGKAWQLWNPTGYNGQSMDVKEAGAQAYAETLRQYGFKAYMGSRAD